jgi:hypothetical protein
MAFIIETLDANCQNNFIDKIILKLVDKISQKIYIYTKP